MKSSILRKTYLLFWKNLVLLKRHYIVTLCEIILPTLFTIALAYIRTKVQVGGELGVSNSVFFEEYSEQNLVDPVVAALYSHYDREWGSIIGHVPNNTDAKEVIEKMLKTLNTTYPIGYPYNETKVTSMGFSSEEEMESYYVSTQYGSENYDSTDRPTKAKLAFCLVFDGLKSNRVSYKIRLTNNYFYDTKNLMPRLSQDGPSFYSAQQYQSSSFSGIQLLLDKVLFEEITGGKPEHNMSMQAFPYPSYTTSQGDIDDLYYIFLPQFIVLGFLFAVPTVVRGVVSEKETGIKELMKMSGLPDWMHWLGWMLNSMAVLTITVTVIVIILFVPFSDNGAVLKHTDPTLFWVVLMVYAVWTTTYCFSVASFFERPTLATTFAIVIWLVSFNALGLAMEESYGKDLVVGVKLLLCIFPNVAIHLGLKVISTFEAEDKGSTWGNIADPISTVNSMSLLYILLMFLVSICLNLIICIYVEAVMPKKFGVRKPFYFIFQPSEWGFRGKNANETYDKSTEIKPGFEAEPSGIKTGVEIRMLRKEFGKGKVAVNDISMNIFEGQIFCLLGENGAGKTTTMSILTGLFAPTSGTAIINGKYDIRKDMVQIRESLGLCPQHNMLFDKLTVIEHLKFFGMLKGLSGSEAMKEAKELLETLRIEEKKHSLSISLSGGQKRRLSLGCALIGGSKVIFLDEPTSGMDPESRRAIWDILLRIRGERTIVLTTHFMEEADVLGDRIAIMASGSLQCCGSPSFLKRYYGAGYTLSMTVTNKADKNKILDTTRKHIADAHMKASLSNNVNELSIILPSENNASSKFPNLLAELGSKKVEFGIDEIGVGWTTMDEVFVRVEELSHTQEPTDVDDDLTPTDIANNNEIRTACLTKATGLELMLSQFTGLFMKKLLYSMRRKRLIFSQMIVPVLLTIAAVAISSSMYSTSNRTPPLTFSLSPYKKAITLYSSTAGDIGDAYKATVGKSAKLIDAKYNNNVSLALLDVGRENLPLFRENHIIAAEINKTSVKAMFSTIAEHSAPLSMNMLTNAFLRNANPSANYEIEATNHPFSDSIYEMLEPAKENPEFTTIISIIFGVMVPIGLALLTASYMVAPTEERLSQGKQLQMMTGVNPMLYWCSMMLCDYFLMLTTIALMVACLPIFEKHKTFTNNDGAGIIFLIMALYGLATVSFSYIFSTFVKSVAGGFTAVALIHLVTGVGLGIGSYTLEEALTDPTSFVPTFINVVGRIFPTFGVTKGSIQYAKISSSNSRCSALTKLAKEILCVPNFLNTYRYYGVTQDCCDNCKDLGDRTCFEAAPYLEWTRKITNGAGKTFYVPGITQDIVWLVMMAVVHFVILMLVEYDVFKMLKEKIFKEKGSSFQCTVDDDDVKEENNRVKTIVSAGRTSDDAIVVESICKSFDRFSAVSQLSFGVHHGECFGLLGVNGAGKTTTFRMLTGDETRSSGHAYMNNLSLATGRKEFLSKLGYCPQFDGIIGVLTGKEMLSLFAKLRGIPGQQVNTEAEKWLGKAGLSKSGNVQCQKYSGGMKRRLSAAMALIGDPPVILLDEPTSGVDPVARRQFWKIISSIKNSGQAIILTSHSMEECEALCSRLGIMVNGEMQCLGGVQHLKNKFAQGYSLTIKLNEICLESTEIVNNISERIYAYFNPCTLKDSHQTTMKFQINTQTKTKSWEELYRTMESIKQQFPDYIDEYAITETTLEEVFLSFARKQYLNERATQSRKCLNKFRIC